ncbi:MAG: hypothetical protein K0S47_4724 [Herbinix sp.]|jgi:hypothetical protein|nr:hypothetical protein [Herbinix sp.]
MKDNAKSAKISFVISIVSIIICFVAVIISAINLRYTIVNGKDRVSDVIIFYCTISVLFANITIFISCNNKYKNHPSNSLLFAL